MNPYLGHINQASYIEEHRLVGGRGDGLRLFELDNGLGLRLTVSADRCCDISRLSFKGINMGYMSPCGYVSPAYYDGAGDGFLKSFTAGFLTTCGLQAVGNPCTDNGEALPLHGSIANTPADRVSWSRTPDSLRLEADLNDSAIFARKLTLHRVIDVSLTHNQFTITDMIRNEGGKREPLEILYHMNVGYPLLDEDSVVAISSEEVLPRDGQAAQHMEDWMTMERPQSDYVERCYYHVCSTVGCASVFQPKLGVGLEISFDPQNLDRFTEWKMMGVRDYVLGLEPGNCWPDGRDVMRRKGILKFLSPGEEATYTVRIKMLTE